MNALTPFTPSPSWREITADVHRYMFGGQTVGLVQRIGDEFFAEADRRRDGRPLHLGRFASKLAAMAVVQDAIIGPSSVAAALGREAIAADPLPHDEFHGFQSFVGY